MCGKVYCIALATFVAQKIMGTFVPQQQQSGGRPEWARQNAAAAPFVNTQNAPSRSSAFQKPAINSRSTTSNATICE